MNLTSTQAAGHRPPHRAAHQLVAVQLATFLAAAALSGCAGPALQPPQVNASAGTQTLQSLPPKKAAEMVTVSIYEFRSAVSEIGARGTTDMFKTALVHSGRFRVVERSRLNDGVIREKQLNASGLTKGNAAAQPLTEAKYIFEGAVTEANASQTQRSGAVRIAGVEFGSSSNQDVIGIDVRVVDAASGEIVNVVTVRQAIASSSQSVSGLGNLVGPGLSRKRQVAAAALAPDLELQQQRKQSLDGALRAAIDASVLELARHLAP